MSMSSRQLLACVGSHINMEKDEMLASVSLEYISCTAPGCSLDMKPMLP